MFVLRPNPSQAELEALVAGEELKGLASTGVSFSWWQKGALVVDDAGPAVIDAEGRRVPVPVPGDGGVLLRWIGGSSGGAHTGPNKVFYLFYVCERDGRALAVLPGITQGFDTEAMDRFAEAAGLEVKEQVGGTANRVPGFVTLLPCANDDDYRRKHRGSRILRKIGIGMKEEWSPYYRGRSYPPMDPAYLDAGRQDR